MPDPTTVQGWLDLFTSAGQQSPQAPYAGYRFHRYHGTNKDDWVDLAQPNQFRIKLYTFWMQRDSTKPITTEYRIRIAVRNYSDPQNEIAWVLDDGAESIKDVCHEFEAELDVAIAPLIGTTSTKYLWVDKDSVDETNKKASLTGHRIVLSELTEIALKAYKPTPTSAIAITKKKVILPSSSELLPK